MRERARFISDRLGGLLARSRRRWAFIAAAALLALAAGFAAVVAVTDGSGASEPAKAGGKATDTASKTTATGGRCQGIPGRDRPGVEWHGNPREALPLRGDSLAPATHVALRWSPRTYPANRGARVVEAAFAPEAHMSVPIRKTFGCPGRVYRRTIFTVVVYPHSLGASTHVSKLFIARFPGDRYRVWSFLHS